MQRLQTQRLQNQHVQSALNHIGIRIRHRPKTLNLYILIVKM
jgi:hypothetical protein